MRHRTGLRNRRRSGRSTYSTKGKGKTADRYGAWSNGRQERPDTIAGHACAWRLRASGEERS